MIQQAEAKRVVAREGLSNFATSTQKATKTSAATAAISMAFVSHERVDGCTADAASSAGVTTLQASATMLFAVVGQTRLAVALSHSPKLTASCPHGVD